MNRKGAGDDPESFSQKKASTADCIALKRMIFFVSY